MTISITPSDFASAMSQGAKTVVEAATNLVRSFVETRLVAELENVRTGKNVSGKLHIRIDNSVTHNSSHHTEAVRAVEQELRYAKYQARYGSQPAYDDGPCRYSPAYEYIEITL